MHEGELQVGASPPATVRLAGVLVGLQGLAGIGVAGAILARAATGAGLGAGLVAEAGYFLVVGVAVLAAGWGLYGGRRWSRTPAIVTQLLLLPVVYSLLGPSRQLLLGGVALVYVVATLLLLISARSRAWWTGEPDQNSAGQP